MYNYYTDDLEAILALMKSLNSSDFAAMEGSPYAIPVQSRHEGDTTIIGYLVDEVGEYSFIPRGTEWFEKVHTSHRERDKII